jgi:hypothetical protein
VLRVYEPSLLLTDARFKDQNHLPKDTFTCPHPSLSLTYVGEGGHIFGKRGDPPMGPRP